MLYLITAYKLFEKSLPFSYIRPLLPNETFILEEEEKLIPTLFSLTQSLSISFFVMAKIINFISKRSYAVVAESLRFQMAATSVVGEGKVSESASANASASNKEEVFWMRDPKTGNWIPENHIGVVDAAELREKFLPKRQNL